MLSRRAFNQLLAASSMLWPLWGPRRLARAQAGSKRHLLIIHSLAPNIVLWQPKSAAGQPIMFGDCHQALKPVADDIVMIEGLTPANPNENHSSPQSLTGRGFGAGSWLSVDRFIAQSQNLREPLLLGIQAGGESQFHNPDKTLVLYNGMAPIDDPFAAYRLVFGGKSTTTANDSAGAAATDAFDEKSTLDLVGKQLKDVRSVLGLGQQKKVDQHLDALARLQGGSGGGMPTAGCKVPAAPDLGGADPLQQSSTLAVGEAQAKLAVAALGCGLSDVVGIQWGLSNFEYLGGALNMELHGAIHSGNKDKDVIAGESYLTDWFVRLLAQLKATADPMVSGKSLFETTLVMWTRDFGHQSGSNSGTPGHANYSMPYILAGATDYLKTSPGGLYLKYAGDNVKSTSGLPHERLLYNLCEAMGVSNFQHTLFGSLAASDRVPLPEVKR